MIRQDLDSTLSSGTTAASAPVRLDWMVPTATAGAAPSVAVHPAVPAAAADPAHASWAATLGAALAVAALLVLVKGLGLRVVVRFSSSEPPAQSAGDTRSRLLAP
mgnify:CR=1 FL=1